MQLFLQAGQHHGPLEGPLCTGCWAPDSWSLRIWDVPHQHVLGGAHTGHAQGPTAQMKPGGRTLVIVEAGLEVWGFPYAVFSAALCLKWKVFNQPLNFQYILYTVYFLYSVQYILYTLYSVYSLYSVQS